MDEEELKNEIILKKKRQIKKELFKTRKNNHIGYGISSNVFKVKVDEEFISCKVIKQNWEKQAQKEINILKNVAKLNLEIFPKFICTFNQNLSNVICYNYISGVDLFTYISESKDFYKNEPLIIDLIRQVLNGLKSLLTINLVHLDIKPENIIIQSKNPIKISIIDLSFCLNLKKNNVKQSTILGTIGYISPEMLFNLKFYHNSDVWSIGIIIFLLYTNTFLFDVEDNEYVYNIKSSKRVNAIVKKETKKISKNFQEIINKCIVFNTNNRISIVGLIKLINSIY
tara:strand:+ start:3904 stop:4755 length:852 start_codon:yes stop_codon:yes gene_type:complete